MHEDDDEAGGCVHNLICNLDEVLQSTFAQLGCRGGVLADDHEYRSTAVVDAGWIHQVERNDVLHRVATSAAKQTSVFQILARGRWIRWRVVR